MHIPTDPTAPLHKQGNGQEENNNVSALVVDLDGTLIRTDLLLESALAFLKKSPQKVFQLIVAFFAGRLALKNFLATSIELNVGNLPYDSEVISFIKKQKRDSNVKVVLASASAAKYVEAIANHVSYFDEWHGSQDVNLVSGQKLALIIEKYGSNVRYIGNSTADIPIWKGLGQAYIANPSPGLTKLVKKAGIPYVMITKPSGTKFKTFVKTLRVHQWSKNALVLLPFLAAHKFLSVEAWVCAFVAFLAFSFTASAVYVMNDMLDVNSDRAHPSKRSRPFASGALALWWGLVLVPLLLTMAAILSLFLPLLFGLTIALYFTANVFYSFHLKKVHTLDLVLLAGMYTARLVAGGEATDSRITPWLAAFSIFFFFGLAAVKRFTEISEMLQRKVSGRGYYLDDKLIVLALGVSTSMLSVLVFALYVNSPQVADLYSHPVWLWTILPLLLYWTSRIWIAAGRGEVHSDPVLHALKDKQSYVLGAIAILFIGMAM